MKCGTHVHIHSLDIMFLVRIKRIVDSHFRKAEKHELLKKSSQTSDLNDRISFFSSNFTLFTQHNQKILNGQINFVLIYFFVLDNFGLFTINAAKIK